MPFVPAPNGAEVELRCTQEGQLIENVLHFKKTSAYSDADLLSLATDIKAWWNTNIKPIVVATLSLREIIARSLENSASPSISYTTGLPIAGTGAGTAPPMNVTAAVKLLTAFSGRGFRGRLYHLGMRAGQLTGSTINTSDITAILAAYNALRTYSFSDGLTVWAVLSKFLEGAPRSEGLLTPILNIGLNAISDSQRRRLPERGR